jgi:hypothetical protein
MFRYDPPAKLDDLAGRPTRQTFLDDWHQFISQEFITNITDITPPGGVAPFFTETQTAATSGEVPVTWDAFPLSIGRLHPQDRPTAWSEADQLGSTTVFTAPGAATFTAQFRPQDEYCEWYVYRDPATQKITRIVLTAEGPEYWIRLANHDIARVVSLYQKLVSPQVKKADLLLPVRIQFVGDILAQGTYNPYNIWNTQKGVMHLTHPANTLGAEINLAARATVLRKAGNGARITDVRRLACCSTFGDANRSSDPTIGQAVNLTVLPPQAGVASARVTLANPVGLYMNKIRPGALTDDQGNPLDNWFRFERGVAGRGLMAVVEPPAGSAIGFDRVQVLGVPLDRGGQLAAVIQMVLYAKAAPASGAAPALEFCEEHCCMPKGTPPQKIKDVNLDQSSVVSVCAAPQREDAFPEILPPPVHAGVGAAPAAAKPHKRPGKSRLVAW